MICTEQRQEFFDFVNARLDADFTKDKSRCIAAVEGDKILGVVVFDRFSRYGCELNVASATPRFLSRALIKLVFYYVFVTCGIIRITTIVKETNEKSIGLNRWLGFEEEARLKRAYGDQDGVVFRMLKDECKWLT